jgi:tetratricopeptide (TPR) repeat protein
LRDVSAVYGNIGAAYAAEGSLPQAREYFEKTLEGLKKIVEQNPDDLQALRNLSGVCGNLGLVAEAEGNRKEAKKYFAKAQKIESSLSSSFSLPRWIKGLFKR